MTEHSPLGASGAERWIHCPGSVALLKRLDLPESDEPDYRREGTCAHEGAAKCLANGYDAWEVIGEKFRDTVFDEPMAAAVQVYLDTVRKDEIAGCQVFTELRLAHPGIHKDMFGTLDRAIVNEAESTMIVTDYKHGEGVQVDIDDNPQLKYYAFMLLMEFDHIRKVKLRIVQPRGFHPDGPVRKTDWLNADDIVQWAEEVLVPAMNATAVDNTLDTGEWCRFCPAKLVCPMLTGLFKAACETNPQQIVNLNSASLGREFTRIAAAKHYIKALEDETFRRNSRGDTVPGTKLVLKKANRVWKPEAEDVFKAEFGDEAYTKPELRSPANMEAIGSKAKSLVKEYAYTPQTGLTVALESDKRPAVRVQTTTEAFGAALEHLKETAA